MTDELLQRVKDLEEEVERLKNQLRLNDRSREADDENTKTTADTTDGQTESKPGVPVSRKKTKKQTKERPFDFSAHPRRHVALRLAYLGWGYQGFAVQENTDNTVEARLFEALLKTQLIQDRQTSNYHRCGRTDKGVSAFSQVITIDLRSSQFSAGLGVTLPDKPADGTPAAEPGAGRPAGPELPYLKMLNRVLPQDIRALDWAPAAHGFSARFDCQSRTYRYYFTRGTLDVALMAEAAARYVGTHDFRNLCKMDVGNGVLQFQRTILAATIRPVRQRAAGVAGDPQDPQDDPYDLFVFEIKGLAFLYHQVRCMMAVLLLIGQKLESPEIIDQLLDVSSNPRKPQYSMAVDFPLVLYDCDFPGLAWGGGGGGEELGHVGAALQQLWTRSAVETQVLRGMTGGLEAMGAAVSQSCWLVEGSRQKNYKPLLERPCCESLEARIQHFVKRGRLERDDAENGGEMVHRGKRSKHFHGSAQPSDKTSNSSEQN